MDQNATKETVMNVRIMGPNLNSAAQAKGDFHVHADGCGDCSKYGPGRKFGGGLNGEKEMLVKDATVRSIILAVYDNGIIDESVGEYGGTRESVTDSFRCDFYFAPCVGKLAQGEVPA